MPRSRGDKEYRIPTRGLNTEASPLDFPQDAAVDINNLILDFDPLRLRVRLGHTDNDISPSSVLSTLTADTGSSAFSWFLWEKAGGDPSTNFLIVQVGGTIFFIDADSTDVNTTVIGALSLNAVISGTIKGTLALAQRSPIQYSAVKGNIVITAEAIDPTLFRYDTGAGTIIVTRMDLKTRDTIGLESGIAVDRRPLLFTEFPAGSVVSGTYAELSEFHEYNLYNQGWFQQRRLTSGSKVVSDPIAEFFTQNSEHASNADIVFIGMVDATGDLIFDAEFLKDQTFGSSPTARGHYVVQAFDIDRETPRTTPSDSGAFTGGGGANQGDASSDWTDIVLGPL